MHTVQNKVAALKKKKKQTEKGKAEESWLVSSLCVQCVSEISHRKDLFYLFLLMIKVCPTLTFEAASKQTKPMLKSTVSPMRWLSMIQAYVLHCRIGEEDC